MVCLLDLLYNCRSLTKHVSIHLRTRNNKITKCMQSTYCWWSDASKGHLDVILVFTSDELVGYWNVLGVVYQTEHDQVCIRQLSWKKLGVM